MKKRKSVEAQIVKRLEDFTGKLENGEDMPVTVITCEQTPDGPLHTSKKTTLRKLLRRRKHQ